jgi:ABC-type branched-subunit amino acid transport system ATPase component
LIGPNGAGKTTLLNAICGLADMSAGPINLDGADLTHLAARDRVDHGLVRGFQTVRPMERKTPLDNVLSDANGCRNRAFCLRCSTCGRRGSAVGATSMSFVCVELAWFARRRPSHGGGLPFATRR